VSPAPSAAEALLAHHLAFRPVDATFMGIGGHDDRLPDASASAAAAERAALNALAARIAAEPEPGDLGARIDRRLVAAQVAVAASALDHHPRFANPAWFTGEAAFGVIGLLLPQSAPTRRAAVLARLTALPDFLADGRSRLAGLTIPAAWVRRAEREATAMARFLRAEIRLHADWDGAWATPAEAAAEAFEAFGASLSAHPDRPSACGEAHLRTLMADGHGLSLSPAEAVARAEAAFERMTGELEAMAARIDPNRSWSEQIAALATDTAPSPDAVIDTYRAWDDRAGRDGAGLVTIERDYGLDYRWLDPCFAQVSKSLYFLSYRSPPAAAPGSGGVYWVAPPEGDGEACVRANPASAVKVIHAVHHGSVGHHTQNARARTAASPLARLAGTDGALGLAFVSSGSMVEGWACYVQDLMAEAPGFYTPAETLLLKQMERRNAASVLVDIRLATGEWSPRQAMAFYRDEAGFAPARVEAEVTRNTMLPGTRLMYWLGIEQIRRLRARWRGDTRAFHDTLIGFGHIPVAWAGEEMARAGMLRPQRGTLARSGVGGPEARAPGEVSAG
jgi:hypothetical protein